jgi:Putative auto-transporter adhesin, head GIN domain
MKRIITIIVATFLMSNVFAQKEIRKVGDFNQLKISSAMEVLITKGDKNEVKVVTESSEIAEKVITEVKGKVLSIFAKGKIKTKEGIKIYVTYKELRGIEQTGATKLNATNAIQTQAFYLKGSGATEIDLNLEVTELVLSFSGASQIKLKGKATHFEVSLTGASELNATNFKATNVKIKTNGASEVNIYAEEEIKGTASGASSVKVTGGASTKGIKSSGAASISKG